MSSVVIYTRKFCGFCSAAKALFARKEVSYREFDGTQDMKIRQEMISKSGRTTFPQIFINEKHIGGYDDLYALNSAGKLDQLLKA